MSTQDVHPDATVRGRTWSWREPERGEHFRRCSWCGSIHPEDLAAEPSWLPEWADQKYGWPHKFYVDVTNQDPERLYVIGSSWGPSVPTGYTVEWIAWDALTPDQLEVARRDGYFDRDRTPSFVYFGTRPKHHAKFYTIHLSDPELDEAVKHTIEQRSGLAFDFEDGRVRWRRAET